MENKVQKNAKKNLPLLKEMLLNRTKILKRVGSNLNPVVYPTDLLKDGEFFSLDSETFSSLSDDQIGKEKYAIFEALAEGKQVQFKHYGTDTQWHDFTPFNINCHFDALNSFYRIKPEIPADTVIKWRSPKEIPESSARQIILHYPDGSMNIVNDTKGYTYHDGWAYV